MATKGRGQCPKCQVWNFTRPSGICAKCEKPLKVYPVYSNTGQIVYVTIPDDK